MNKAIFLDRDGTINIDYGYVYKIEDFKFIEGTIEGLKMLSNLGYKLIIISNQSGVSRGYFKLEDLEKLNNYIVNCLKEKDIIIDKIYCCTHTDSDNCNCRKPKLELFYKAIKDFNIDINNSYAIGDRERDLSICEIENIKGILITDNNNDKYVCMNNLFDAAKYIERNIKNEKNQEVR